MSGQLDPTRVHPDGIDADMKRLQWLNWAVQGDKGKVPKQPANPSRNGKSNDATTWGTFGEARNAAEGREIGVGLPFAQANPFTAIDIDLPDGTDWVPDVDRLDGALVERSPSGNLRVLLRDVDIPHWWTNQSGEGRNAREVKLFTDSGYVTITGDAIEEHGSPIEPTEQEAFVGWLKDAWRAFNPDSDAKPWEGSRSKGESGPRNRGKDAGNHPAHGENPDIGVYDVLSASSFPEGKRQAHPVHGSDTGTNFQVDEGGETWRCWRHDTTGSALHLVGMQAGVISCGEWETGGLDTEQWREVFDAAREQGYDVPEQQSTGERLTKQLRQSVTDEESGDRDGEGSKLTPMELMAVAGLGENDNISDLNDRQMAACVWELIVKSYDVHVRVQRENDSLWAYDDGVWKQEGERALRHAARKALPATCYSSNVLKQLKAQALSDPRAEMETEEMGLETGTVAVENGLVNLDVAADALRTGDSDLAADAIRELRPDDLALTRLPVGYDPSAEYGEWQNYVEEWAEKGKADALQEYVGYCLHIGALPIHRALLLVGSGANGKGTFLSVVREMVGAEKPYANTTSIELQTLANERDAVADFFGALANIDDDLSSRNLGRGLGMFKKLVGGDRVRGRHLYEGGFEFDAVGKHLYAANKVPNVDVPDDDEAFWRRWLLVEFPNYYPPKERDPDLREELAEDEELSGVLNWAIQGRARLLEQGYFTGEDRLSHDKRRRWQSWGDTVDEFIAECVEHDPDADRMTTGEAYQRFTAWCAANDKDHDGGQQGFTNTLKSEDVGYGKHRIDGVAGTNGYKSLGLSDDVPEIDDDSEADGEPSHNSGLSNWAPEGDDADDDDDDTDPEVKI